ncbi:MAG: response regulator transcription factor [Clostridiales bacterium]|nr:response regulator transcription factor [Clostridiales bacterium]
MRILIADDETELTRALKAIFVHNGYETDVADNGADALALALENEYDAMIFDIMMPKMTGLEALNEIRTRGIDTPVILLTAKAQVDDRINGLDSGADDYITKPFAVGELMARVRAATRPKNSKKLLCFGNVELNPESNELRGEGSSLRLSAKETEVLSVLMKNTKAPVSAQRLTSEVWKEDGGELVIYISYLKNKLDAVNANFVINTDNGYILEMKECLAY